MVGVFNLYEEMHKLFIFSIEMELQKFITDNQDWEILLKQKSYNVDIIKHKSFRVLTYTFKSDLKTIAKHCRGTIVSSGDRIVCMPFDKFGHHNQDFSN